MLITCVILALVVATALLLLRQGYLAWLVGFGVLLAGTWHPGVGGVYLAFATLYIVAAVVFGIPALRRKLVSGWMMKMAAGALPRISPTEDIALKAGSTWWEAQFFTGRPRWKDLLDFQPKALTDEEQAFLDGPTTELCAMLNDEQIHQDRDISPEVWGFIKRNKFLGMVIRKEYGGLGFSAQAHSAVVTRLASASIPAAVTIIVPNSLGPGELLAHYGTDAQKKYYLPRLATGDEIPCFALTEPHAGSDAANGRSVGIVCKGTWNGEEVLGMRLTLDKRYITLAPIATVVGLAFHMHDPDHLLGDVEDIGITCALIPRDTPGLVIGNRHDPMGVPFPNGPIRGKDVFVPLECIIGGKDYAGKGWRMLMECLSAGRGISLPSLSVGGAQLASRATGAYALVREQFGTAIGNFEGVRECLARIAGLTYAMDATRQMAAAAVDSGERPSVVAAIAKGYLTDGMRTIVTDAMDITGGSGICRGPRNIFSRAYEAIPIGITVEGANILTRSMMIFGQGAMRCHPFLLKEVEAIEQKDLVAFDNALFGHINHIFTTSARAKVLAWGGSRFVGTPGKSKMEKRHYRRLTRLAAAFALLTDMNLITLGGRLKFKESISGRFADALGWQFIASSALKRYHDTGRPAHANAALDWALTHAEYQVEQALAGVLRNMPGMLPKALKLAVLPFGARLTPPSDRQMHKLVDDLLDPSDALRRALSRDIFIPPLGRHGLGLLEDAHGKVLKAGPIIAKIQAARRMGHLDKAPLGVMAAQARAKGIVDDNDLHLIRDAEAAQDDAIQVDDFTPDAYHARR